VNFWDTSAIVPLLVREPETDLREVQLQEVTSITVWWATKVESISALRRREREKEISPQALEFAFARLDALERQ